MLHRHESTEIIIRILGLIGKKACTSETVAALANYSVHTNLLLVEALRHPDWQVRNASAARLWGDVYNQPEVIAGLAPCLRDPNEMVRLSAAVSILSVPQYKSMPFAFWREAAHPLMSISRLGLC
jgi:HEAT repeat protein